MIVTVWFADAVMHDKLPVLLLLAGCGNMQETCHGCRAITKMMPACHTDDASSALAKAFGNHDDELEAVANLP